MKSQAITDEIVVLKHAHRKIGEIRENVGLMTDLSLELSFDSASGKGKYTTKKPHPNALTAALVNIRLFLAPGSEVVWGRLYRILSKRLPEGSLSELRSLSEQWSTAAGLKAGSSRLGMNLQLNEEVLTRSQILDWWMNGDVFHLDAEKSEKLALMRGSPFMGLAELQLTTILQELATLLFVLDERFVVQVLSE